MDLNLQLEANVKGAADFPFFHVFKLMNDDAIINAPIDRMGKPHAALKTSREIPPEIRARPPNGIAMQKSCRTACDPCSQIGSMRRLLNLVCVRRWMGNIQVPTDILTDVASERTTCLEVVLLFLQGWMLNGVV